MRVVSRGILRMRKGGTPLRRLDAALTRFSFFTNVSVRFRSLQLHLDSNEPLPALRTESQSAGRGFFIAESFKGNMECVFETEL